MKWSFCGLMVTAILQMSIVVPSGSVALLADTIHNVGDAATAIPLGIAFLFARRPANQTFGYGYGRVEDLAGLVIVGIILLSALMTGYESIQRFIHPQPLAQVGAVAIAAIIGFIGNEAVAMFRIRVGRDIGSAALVADGYHARVDGLTSLAVLLSAIGAGLGYGWADPVIGLVITIAILRIVWDSVQTVWVRLLDGVEPDTLATLRHAVDHVVEQDARLQVQTLRARWSGHRLYADVVLAAEPSLSLAEAEAIAQQINAELLHHVPYLADAGIKLIPS